MAEDKTNILIVGAGKGGGALIELFYKSGTVNIMGVVDINADAPGIKLAKELNIPTATDYKEFMNKKGLKEIINVAGSEKVQEELLRLRPLNVEVLGGHSARLIWNLIEERKQIENMLKESESKFKILAEKSLIGVYLIQDEIFKYVNPRLAEIFGYAVEELIDRKGPQDLTLPEDWSIVKENLLRRISGEVEAINYGFRGITKNNEIIHIEVYGSRIIYNARPAVIGTLLDITKRKRAEEELNKKVKELEEFYNIAIGRELKMIELKEEIEKIKEELEKYKKP
ncbi:MAG: PAS domain S-box protein [Nitrospirota bacterium]